MMIGVVSCQTCTSNQEAMELEGSRMMKLQAKYAQPEKISSSEKRRMCRRQIHGATTLSPSLSMPFKWREQKRSTRSVVFLRSQQRTKEAKKP